MENKQIMTKNVVSRNAERQQQIIVEVDDFNDAIQKINNIFRWLASLPDKQEWSFTEEKNQYARHLKEAIKEEEQKEKEHVTKSKIKSLFTRQSLAADKEDQEEKSSKSRNKFPKMFIETRSAKKRRMTEEIDGPMKKKLKVEDSK